MSFIRTTTLLTALAALTLAACSTTNPPKDPPMLTTTPGPGRFLHTSGTSIVDGNNNPVLLRGVGLGNWMLPEGYMWHFNGGNADRPRRIEKIFTDLVGPEKSADFWQKYRTTYITQSDINRIAALGFNSCRPALDARMFLSEDGSDTFHEESFVILDNLIKWAKAANVYVIIDMHAAPGGETGQNIDDSATDEPLLFMDPKYEARLTKLWVKIADRYKDEPTVAAYDLLNEPLPKKTGAADKYKHLLQPIYMRLDAAIRKVDNKHMITVEGADWANDWSVFTTKFDDNMVHQFHYYCWDNPTNVKDIQKYLDVQNKLHTPIWVGETGERDADIYFATTDLFESHNIGWSFWPWKKTDAANGIYSAKLPAGWDAIVNYAADPKNNPKPSPEAAEKMLNQLLENVKLENCTFTPTTVNALLRQLPLRIEAENYGHGGPEISYHLTSPTKKSPLYRKTEPVPIEPLHIQPTTQPAATQPTTTAPATQRRRRRNNNGESGQAIHLNAGEWTTYQFTVPESRDYPVTIKYKTTTFPAAITITLNGRTFCTIHPEQSDKTDPNGYYTADIAANDPLLQGPCTLKLSADTGSFSIDWINFK